MRHGGRHLLGPRPPEAAARAGYRPATARASAGTRTLGCHPTTDTRTRRTISNSKTQTQVRGKESDCAQPGKEQGRPLGGFLRAALAMTVARMLLVRDDSVVLLFVHAGKGKSLVAFERGFFL